MNAIKITTSKNTGDLFAARTKQDLWNKLLNYIREHASSMNGVMIDEFHSQIKIKYSSEQQFLDIVDKIAPSLVLDKNVIRTVKLNTIFDKPSKGLSLSNENVEDFSDYNEIFYSFTCNMKDVPKNSIFFHESALVNYMDDFDRQKYDSCTYRLALLNYDVQKLYVKSDFQTEESTYNETTFLCFNETSNAYSGQSFSDTLNQNSSIDVETVASSIRNGQVSLADRTVSLDNDEMIYYSFSNVKLKNTSMRMIDQSPADIIRFFSFLSREKQQEWISSIFR